MNATAKTGKQQAAKSSSRKEGFTAEEKAAMKARARELIVLDSCLTSEATPRTAVLAPSAEHEMFSFG